MTDNAVTRRGSAAFGADDTARRVKATILGSLGNLVEWYDFYSYTAFALYFGAAFSLN